MRFEEFLLNESINDKGIFKAVFMAGTPGSGKTTVARKLSGGVEPRFVSTDTWTEFYKAFTKDKWDFFQEKVNTLTRSQLTLYLNSMLPLWIDGTSSNPSNLLRRKGILEGMGYDVAMIWVDTDLEEAKKRAKEREKRIGRPVDESFIEESYQKIEKMIPFYKGHFREFVKVDNNEGELTDKVVSKLYAKMGNFFASDILNPIGSMHKETLIREGGKYMEDLEDIDIAHIKKLTNAWFGS